MNKRGLNKIGHLVFATLSLVGAYLMLKNHITLKTEWIIYLAPFFIGALAPDIVELPVSASHRSFFHSKRFLFIILLIGLPLSIALGMTASPNYFHLTAFLAGYETHLIGDWLTSSLPR